MYTLKIDHSTSSVSSGGKKEHMKEVVCEACEQTIRFLFAIPNLCPHCMIITGFPDHLFRTINDRVEYYSEDDK